MKPRALFPALVFAAFFFLSFAAAQAEGEWDVLSDGERAVLARTMAHWQTHVPEREKQGTAPLMRFEELYAGLGPEERAFLDRLRAIKPSPLDFDAALGVRKIEGQVIQKPAETKTLNPQYLPEKTFYAFEAMMSAMEQDLGKRLLVESGYRSPAYQLYTFLFYMPKHGYSINETRQWVALPGSSEHGNPEMQAIDFINREGINGEDIPEEFENLPEYRWLEQNASRFGFELSYPRGNTTGTAFEPWHWRHAEAAEAP